MLAEAPADRHGLRLRFVGVRTTRRVVINRCRPPTDIEEFLAPARVERARSTNRAVINRSVPPLLPKDSWNHAFEDSVSRRQSATGTGFLIRFPAAQCKPTQPAAPGNAQRRRRVDHRQGTLRRLLVVSPARRRDVPVVCRRPTVDRALMALCGRCRSSQRNQRSRASSRCGSTKRPFQTTESAVDVVPAGNGGALCASHVNHWLRPDTPHMERRPCSNWRNVRHCFPGERELELHRREFDSATLRWHFCGVK